MWQVSDPLNEWNVTILPPDPDPPGVKLLVHIMGQILLVTKGVENPGSHANTNVGKECVTDSLGWY